MIPYNLFLGSAKTVSLMIYTTTRQIIHNDYKNIALIFEIAYMILLIKVTDRLNFIILSLENMPNYIENLLMSRSLRKSKNQNMDMNEIGDFLLAHASFPIKGESPID